MKVLDERRKTYGDVRDNMGLAQSLIAAYRDNAHIVFGDYLKEMNPRDLNGFLGSLDMVMHKVARMLTGPVYHEDNFQDAKGYIELMRRIAAGEMDAGRDDG